MMRKLLAIAALTFVAAVALPRPADQSGSPESLQRPELTGAHGGNLVAALSTDPRTFNRLLTPDFSNTVLADRMSGDLVHINRLTFELEPSLAQRWELERDGRTYTIHLRRGLRFSDGASFTADDVLFTLQAVEDPKTGSPFRDVLSIDGVFPKISKLNDHAIRMSFPRPVGIGLRGLDSLPILPRHLLGKAYEEGRLPSAWGPGIQPQGVAGMGPFRLKEHLPGQRVVLERNPHYWKKDKHGRTLPYLDSLTFLIIPDRNSEALRLQSGELHVVNALEANNFAALRRRQTEGGFQVRDLGAGLEMDFLWFNLNPKTPSGAKPFVDPERQAIFAQARFRRALSHALDRKGIAKSVLLGLATPQYGPISRGNRVWYNKGLPESEFNPARAREILSGMKLKDVNGDGVLECGSGRALEFTLLTSRGNARRERTVQVIRENLAAVGVRVETQLLDQRDLVQRLRRTFEYEAMLFGFTPTDVTPDILSDLWLSSGSNHFWYPNQPEPATPWEKETDSLVSSLIRTIEPAARLSLFNKIQEIWARELPAIPTVSPSVLVAWRSDVGNLRPSVLGPHLLWNAEELTLRSR